ncbi:MAG: hypothetical protein M0T85_08850 [Dehalococcoidales bacterium]|nr:hypothetical protein [Dehalococcoidales bacterium]
MRRDVENPMCLRECEKCRFQGVIPQDCPGKCLRCRYSRYCPCGNRFIHPQLMPMAKKESKSAEIREIAIDSIRYDSLPGTYIVACDEAMLKILGRLIRRFGQPRPLIVSPEEVAAQYRYRLVGGMDIFLAVRALGQRGVLARIAKLDEYKATVQFYRYELMRLDLSWENQARYLLALHELYRERQYFPPSLPTLSALSGVPMSRIRDLLHGIELLKSHNLSDGTIPFPTLLRPIRTTYPEALQKEMIRGLVEEGWTRRRATEYAAERLTVGSNDAGKAKAMDREFHLNLVDVSLTRSGNEHLLQPARNARLALTAAGGGR